ncbi:glycoside hydrolase family 31 protein [Colwellia piezophila]|uniref:glycoside hydrolase family 31 protein n=1 Tax=Colwellia piezophila TaxID=211668 RepID=UPI0003611AF3|nr:glycoside hydrolase family 31 protein [Colwellia piezophila]
MKKRTKKVNQLTLVTVALTFALYGCNDVTQTPPSSSISPGTVKTEQQQSTVIEAAKDQQWWAAVTRDGDKMPLQAKYSVKMLGDTFGNQVQPLLLSANGYVIWSEKPFSYKYDGKGSLTIFDNLDEIIQHKAGDSLKDAADYASKTFFPPSGKMVDELLFTAPQFNTWIELTYNQNQEDILKYAERIISEGFKPGVLMIDDTWQTNYGDWTFNPARFSDPKAMMDKLHAMGFKVMLWVAPFVSGDIPAYRELKKKGGLLRQSKALVKIDKNDILLQRKNKKSPPQMVEWWNGQSAVLDLTNPVDKKWFKDQLDHLQQTYGVDGFKFDAGDARSYTKGVGHKDILSNEHSEAFAEVGLDYPLNEYRATWKMGGQPIAQRLRDKFHTWEDMQKLIPQMNMMGMVGYPFSCPDMIGGGNWISFQPGKEVDAELIVRSAQTHALMPMMQFSVAPWRILDQEHQDAIKVATKLRLKFNDYILALAKTAAKTGAPIMRPLEYNYPHQGYIDIKDQFLMGDNLLVAPVITKTKIRKVTLPPGKWLDHNGKTVEGGQTINVPVQLDTLPHYWRVSA